MIRSEWLRLFTLSVFERRFQSQVQPRVVCIAVTRPADYSFISVGRGLQQVERVAIKPQKFMSLGLAPVSTLRIVDELCDSD